MVSEVPVEPDGDEVRRDGDEDEQRRMERSRTRRGAVSSEREVSVTSEGVERFKSVKGVVKTPVRTSSCYSSHADGKSFFSDADDKEDV